jgi:hypothetical protein
MRIPVLPPSSPAFIVVVVALKYDHSKWGKMKLKCCFDLHIFYHQGS